MALADARTLEALDFPAIREACARLAASDAGAARLRALVPESEPARVRAEQAATGEMRGLATGGFDLPRVLEVSPAIERAMRGAALPAEELRRVAEALAAADAAVRKVRAASEVPTLAERCRGVEYLAALHGRIAEAIGERDEVLDRASPALARIRRAAAGALEEARARCQALLRSASAAKAIGEPIVTMREGRFVIPVKAEFAGAVPGVVHDTSSSGQTLFVEPLGALDANNRLRTLRLEETREVERILAELSAALGARGAQALANVEALVALDLSLARARLAERMSASAPAIVDDARIEVRAGRHPLLGERAVPQTLALSDEVRFIVISGPNMGGKTVSLKMVGLFVLMAYCGMHLPAAEGSAIGCFEDIGADVGDEQSIAENASTFSAHLRRVRAIVERTGPRSLVLIDELAGGTEPAAGAALGIALLEHLLAAGARGIVTTHATELKLFAHGASGIANASVRFDPATYAPTYELDVGAPGQSLAFPLARALGLNEALVARAEALLGESERDYDRALGELAEIRMQAASERDTLARERRHLEHLTENARKRAEALERERRRLAAEAEQRLSAALRDFSAELERRERERDRTARPRVTAGQAAMLGRVIEEVRRDLGIVEKAAGPAEPALAAVGDGVVVPTLGEGIVADDYGDSVLVAFGALKSVVSKRDLRVVRRAGLGRGSPANRGAGDAALGAAAGAATELDVRGKRFVEAEPLVERWLDEAHMLGISPLRLIHGKGTGLLGRGLQEYLLTHSGVRSLRYGNADEGGSGVTIVDLVLK